MIDFTLALLLQLISAALSAAVVVISGAVAVVVLSLRLLHAVVASRTRNTGASHGQ